MRIAIICIDTRGGVWPYIALGQGLKRAGHTVRLIAPTNYQDMVQGHGVEFAGVSGDIQAIIEDPRQGGAMDRGSLAVHLFMIRTITSKMPDLMRDALGAARDAQLIIAGFGGMLVGEGIAEKLRMPLIQSHLQPLTPTREFRSIVWCPGMTNRLSHVLTRQAFWQPLRMAVNKARREVLGLGPSPLLGSMGRVADDGPPLLYAYSPALLPKPADWHPRIEVTGYWRPAPDPAWRPPTDLQAFMAAGPPPVVIGFGSMNGSDAMEATRTLVNAVESAEQRAVLVKGWGGLGSDGPDETVFPIASVPYDWLLPRAACIVHHGGAGTLGAALTAGIPSVTVIHGADQPFWGWLAAHRGLGPPPIRRTAMTVPALAGAIARCIEDTAMRARVAELSASIRQEDGVTRAVEAVNRFVATLHQ